MQQEQISANADVTLSAPSRENKKMTFDELTTLTVLPPLELAAAIGRLSKENKIMSSFENGKEYYTIYQEYYYSEVEMFFDIS